MEFSPKAKSLYRVQAYGEAPSIEGVVTVDVNRYNDDGGSLTELIRFSAGEAVGIDGFRPAQVNFSSLEPGVIKAFHVHRRQTDVWFVPPGDRVLLVVADVRQGSPSEGVHARKMLGDGRSMLVRIPPGVAHGCRNLGRAPATILYFTDVPFSTEPGECDEGRLPWDLVGPDVWDVASD